MIDALPAFPAQHIVFSRRRRKSTPATAVVMKICTTEFALGMGLMCSTVNGQIGRTSRSAFPAQHIVFSRRRRKGTPATTAVMKICTTEFRNDMVPVRGTVNGRVGRTGRSAFPAQHIVFHGRRRASTPATAVVMKICTTEFALGMGPMCGTVNGRVGRTSRSATRMRRRPTRRITPHEAKTNKADYTA